SSANANWPFLTAFIRAPESGLSPARLAVPNPEKGGTMQAPRSVLAVTATAALLAGGGSAIAASQSGSNGAASHSATSTTSTTNSSTSSSKSSTRAAPAHHCPHQRASS